MRLPRWLHHAYANALGYFWIPCPNGGVPFGGHESIPDEGWRVMPASGEKIWCASCTRARAESSRITFTFDNRDGRWTPR